MRMRRIRQIILIRIQKTNDNKTSCKHKYDDTIMIAQRRTYTTQIRMINIIRKRKTLTTVHDTIMTNTQHNEKKTKIGETTKRKTQHN